VDKKDRELNELRSKVEELSKSLSSSSTKPLMNKIIDLEKENEILSKQIDQYKGRMTNLSSAVDNLKADDSAKEENRKLNMVNGHMKNQLTQTRKEIDKLKNKSAKDHAHIIELQAANQKLEQDLKRQVSAAKGAMTNSEKGDQALEMKKLTIKNQSLETQVKDSASRIAHLEAKLAEALKPGKAAQVAQPQNEESKVKITQLEGSLKKVNQDNNELKNKLDEAKKEINKLRQEKTALQNTSDKLKKDAEKAKSATPPKKGGMVA
jgi:chromosome segregation ATPase